jgi:transposase
MRRKTAERRGRAGETFSGGKPRAHNRNRKEAAIRKYQVKSPIFGMAERAGACGPGSWRIARKPTLHGTIREYVLPESMIFTDEYYPYVGIERHFQGHKRIRHREGIYVQGDVHTNTIEGFFGLLKNGIRGVYHSVSREYLQSYLDEYAFRYNRRNSAQPMFWAILEQVRKPQASAA